VTTEPGNLGFQVKAQGIYGSGKIREMHKNN